MVGKMARKFYKIVTIVKAHYFYNRDRKIYQEKLVLSNSKSFAYQKKDKWAIYYDRFKTAGDLDPHYFLQDIFMAKCIIENHIFVHHDIGSRVDGFISHLLSAGVQVTMIDIRPLPYKVKGLSFIQGDATDLDSIENDSIESLSSLHAVEHFGLGRYGDPVEPDAWKKALSSMERVVKPGGMLFLAVPVGNRDALYFNAHRVFKIDTIPKQLSKVKLERVAYIYNYKVIELNPMEIQNVELESEYCCGLYVFRKL